MARRPKSDREDCIEKLVKLSGGKFSREEAEDLLQEILNRAERQGPSWKAIDERLAAAAKELEDQLIERASIAKRNERMAAMKAIALHKYIHLAATQIGSPAQGLEAKLGGINVPFAGSRLSVDSQYRGLRRSLLGGLWNDLMGARTDNYADGGIEKLFLSRKIEQKWAAELHELNKAKGGKPGITGDPEALKIAEIVMATQRRAIEAINSEGGWVKSYSGYIARTSHDPDRIRRMGRERWIDLVMEHLDVERTFHDPDVNNARKALADLWPDFVTGDHFDYSRPLDDTASLLDVDFARKASAPRELHWKDASGWLAYNEKAGRFTPTFAVIHAFDSSARITALMKELGPTPREALEEAFRYIRSRYKKSDPDYLIELDKLEARIRNIFAQFDGTAQRPVNALFARIMSDTRSVTRMAKLGLTPYAMLSDLATKASELRYQGFDPLERYGSTITDYFRGHGFVRGANLEGEKRQVGELLMHFFDSEIGQIAARFDPGEAPAHNAIARAEQAFFRITGMNSMTYNQRHGAERVMAAHWGMLRGADFATLSEAERRVLSMFEIGGKEWDLLHKVAWNDVNGTTYLTPEVATRLLDADVRAYLVDTGRLRKDAKEGPTVNVLVKKTREDLALKLAAYFADRGEYAVLEPGARERGVLYGGASARDWAPGTVKGEALRMFLQFKQFPATVMMRTWGREIYGGQGKLGAISGLAQFFAYATVLGIVANALNQLTKGQDPTAPWRNNPATAVVNGMIRGGAGSIYGDFLLGEFSRFGRSALGTLAGPTFGQVDTLLELYSDLIHLKSGKATAGTSLRFVRDNAPFANMIYTKMAVDYVLFYTMMEWINPGYLERMERTMKDKQGVEFWLRPTQVSR